CQQYTTSPYNF
nr:immunoglobulin light chain junction region [Macaca mulatta]